MNNLDKFTLNSDNETYINNKFIRILGMGEAIILSKILLTDQYVNAYSLIQSLYISKSIGIRAINKLVKLGVIEKKITKVAGEKMTYIKVAKKAEKILTKIIEQ